MKISKIISSIIIAFLLVIVIFSSVVIIPAGHRGVLLRFSKVTGTVYDEGIHFKIPIVEKVWKAEVRVRKDEAQASAASKDMQDVTSTIALNYHLDYESVQIVYQTIGKDFAGRIIDPSVQETFKAVTAKYNVSELLTKRSEVKEEVKRLLTERLSKYNIIVDDLSIINFSFSKQFSKSIEEKQVAQQDAERANYQLEKAQKEAEAIKVQAEALKQNPDLVAWEAVKKWDGHMPKVTGGSVPFINVD